MTYQTISAGTPDSFPLDVAPSSTWIISTLEIVVSVGREKYLLLTLPSYSLDNQPIMVQHDEGYWAPPFMAYPVESGFSPPSTVGSIRRQARVVSDAQISRDIHHMAYQMGLRDVELESRESFIEIKVSPRTPGVVKAYVVLRHSLSSISQECLRNLADPEVRRGYVFLPINSERPSVVSRRPSSVHQRDESWFLGKPLQSNVDVVLEENGRSRQLEANALPLPATAFARSEVGLIIACDLRAYGRALQYAEAEMAGFLGSGEQAADHYRREIAERFQEFAGTLGITQLQVAGDGLVAALPARLGLTVDEVLSEVGESWQRLVGSVNELNARIRDNSIHVGSRLALHYGSYVFGRVAGPLSAVAGFDGASIIETVRMEQALAAAMSGPGLLGDHLVVMSNAVEERRGVEQSGGTSWFEHVGRFDLSAKEFSTSANVYKVV